MTTRELTQLLDRSGTLQTELERLTIPVVIVDVRSAYGRTHVLIRPLHGSGETWVTAERVKLDEPKKGGKA